MNPEAVYTFAKWQVKEGQLDTVLELLAETAKKSRKEKGNLFYHLHQGIADPNTIILYEGYVDEAAVGEHRNSAHFQKIVMAKIIPLLEKREVTLVSPLPG